MCGLTIAGLLAKRGRSVTILEKRRSRDEAARSSNDRSINLSLSARALSVFAKLGIEEKVRGIASPTAGRLLHLGASETIFQHYGLPKGEELLTIARHELHRVLETHLKGLSKVTIRYGCEALSVNKQDGSVTFIDHETGQEISAVAGLTIGADGAYSRIRQLIHRGEPAEYTQKFFGWSYKQLHLRASLVSNLVHVWPADDALLIALPERSGGFNANLFLRRNSPTSYGVLGSQASIAKFISSRFPDLSVFAHDLADQLDKNPENDIVQTSTDRWHIADKFVLVGDACHAVYHFYAQGLNAGLEDCAQLDYCLAAFSDRTEALSAYQQRRKPSTDSLAALSEGHFITLQKKARTSSYHAKHILESALGKLLGRRWRSSYYLVSSSKFSHEAVRARLKRREQIWQVSGLNLIAFLFAASIGLMRFARRHWLHSRCQVPFNQAPSVGETRRGLALKTICWFVGLGLSFSSNALALRIYKIGLASTLSDIGTSSSIPHGDFFRRGVRLALKHSSARLKEKDIGIELTEFDYGNDRLKVMEVARAAVASDVQAVIGYNFSDHTILAAPIHQAGRLPLITPTATADRVSELGAYVHPLSFSNSFQAKLLAKIASSQLKVRKSFAVVAQDCTYCQDLAAGFSRAFKAFGGEVIELPVLKGDTNYKEVVDRYKKMGGTTELVFIPNHELTSAAIIQAFLNADVKAPFLGGDGWANYGTRIFESMFQERQFVAYAVTHWHERMPTNLARRFLRDYEQENKQTPNMTAAMAYDSMLYLVDSILNCRAPGRAELEKCLNAQRTFQGVTGHYTFTRPNAAPEKSLVILSRIKGRFDFMKVVTP